MTRLEIRTLVRKGLGETTAAFWTNDELNTYINVGCKDIAWRLKCLRTSGYISSVSCVANTVGTRSNEYTLSTSFPTYFAVNEVYFKIDGERFHRLAPSSREELDFEYPGWMSTVGYTYTDTAGTVTYNYQSQPGIPERYYWNREEDVLGLYPPPDDDQEGASYIKVYYAYNHTDMSSDSSSPTLPVGIHLAVVDFAIAKGFEDRGWGDRANDFWAKYYQKLKDYVVERRNEREDDEIIMKGYRNL